MAWQGRHGVAWRENREKTNMEEVTVVVVVVVGGVVFVVVVVVNHSNDVFLFSERDDDDDDDKRKEGEWEGKRETKGGRRGRALPYHAARKLQSPPDPSIPSPYRRHAGGR
jgi:hypothetical protein